MQSEEANQAIYCNCYLKEYDRYKILGSITSEGMIEILRGHKNKTLIASKEFFIYCRDCGYSKYIQTNLTLPAYIIP